MKDLEINELDRNMICDRILWRRLSMKPIPFSGIKLGCCCKIRYNIYVLWFVIRKLRIKLRHFS
jgi:hypothetical protein